jgi:hypothetical protein
MKNDSGIDATGEASDRQKDQPVDRTSDRRRVLQGVGGVGAFVTILASRPAFAQEDAVSQSCKDSITAGASAPTCEDRALQTGRANTNGGKAYGLNSKSQGKQHGHTNAQGQG